MSTINPLSVQALLNCPGAHGLQRFKIPNNTFYCDICDKNIVPNTTISGCRKCNHDICNICESDVISFVNVCQQLRNLTNFQKQCQEAQQSFSEDIRNELSIINTTILRVKKTKNNLKFPSLTLPNVPLFIKGINSEYIEITIACLKQLNNFGNNNSNRTEFVNTLVHKYSIISTLINILNRNNIWENKDLCRWSMAVLVNISTYTTNIEPFAAADVMKMCFRCIKDDSASFNCKQRSILLLQNICQKTEQFQELCLQANLLDNILPLCTATNHSITLLRYVAQLYAILIPKITNDSYLKQISKALSILIYYNYDNILIPTIRAYICLCQNSKLRRRRILHCVFDETYIKEQYQKKATNDDVLFKKSMAKYIQLYDINIPIAINGLIRQHYDIFSMRKVQNMNCNNLLKRFVDLLMVETKSNNILEQKTFYLIYKLMHSITIRNRLIGEFGIVQWIKKMFVNSKNITQKYVSWMAKHLNCNILIEQNVIEVIVQSINICHNDVIHVILKVMNLGSLEQIECMFKINGIFDSFGLLVVRYLMGNNENDLNKFRENLNRGILRIMRIDISSEIKRDLRKRIDVMRSNTQISSHNRTFLMQLKESMS